jgi:glycosyltransferase involved in cell wall biosynthesis
MKILLSAFAFSPIWGSEPGIGWNFALQLARLHDVTVLTHGYFRTHVEQGSAALQGLRIQVVYLDLEPLRGSFHDELLNSQTYYLRWQWHLLPLARRLCREQRYDLVHHITWGTFRYPSFLGWLGLPFVFGPVGGGESAPMRLFKGLPLKDQAKELLRSAVIASGRIDPLLRACLRKCTVILCRTPQTLTALPAFSRRRAWVAQELGAPPASAPPARERQPGDRLRLLFAGRLLGWKGIHLAIQAVAVALQRGTDVELTIVGSGPLRPFLEHLCTRLALGDRVRFVSQIPRAEMLRLYHEADAFLFPSLHDSGGNVVLEALSRGLPVICLDLGGPPCFMTEHTGVVVETGRRQAAEVVQLLADAIDKLASATSQQSDRGVAAALEHSRNLTWENQVSRVYQGLAGLSMDAAR